jgi:hypothetical protein
MIALYYQCLFLALRGAVKLAVLIFAYLVLAGCAGDYEPSVRFATANCVSTPSDDTRERRVRTSCAMRSNGAMIGNYTKPCIMWNHTMITERRYTLACQRNEWSRVER